MKNKLPISIIIPTFNRFEAIKRTLQVIEKQSSYIPSEIIIIDQSLEKETRDNIQLICSQYRVCEISYIYLETPSSTKARNIGIHHAKNDILVFMDDDVDVNIDTLLNIYLLLKEPDIAMVGAIDETLPVSGGLLGCLFGMKSFRNRKIGHVTNALLGRYPQIVNSIVETMWAMGFCFALKKQYLREWNMFFDEKLTGYAYAEDLDLTYRYYKVAKNINLRCVLSDKVTVKHLETKEYRVPSKRNVFKYVINRKYLAYKYGAPISTHIWLKWANFGLILTRIIAHEPYSDIIDASRRCRELNDFLKNGIIREEFFDENFKIKDL